MNVYIYIYVSSLIFIRQLICLQRLLGIVLRAQAIRHVVPSRLGSLVGEEVTVHNTGISLLLSTSVWVLLGPPIERRET